MIILAYENSRNLKDGCKIKTFVKIAFGSRTISEKSHGDFIFPAITSRPAQPDGMQHL